MKWMVLCIFGGLGLAALIGGLLWGAQRYALFSAGLQAKGRVVENYKSVYTGSDTRTDDTSISYYPVVEFQDAQGQTIRFRGSTGSGAPEYEVGTPVEVLYDRENPYNAQLAAFSHLWLGPVVVSVAGFIFLVMGVAVFFLIGSSDKSMDQMHRMMQREALAMRQDSIRISGTIRDVRAREDGKYVYVCMALRPGGVMEEEFETDFFTFDPGIEFAGRTVTVYLDPFDPKNYYVELGPLLKEIVARHGR